MTLAEYRACLAIARRHARVAADAPELLHEAFLAGVHAGRTSFVYPADRAWLAGTLRHLSAERARSEARRRRREDRWALQHSVEAPAPEAAPDGQPLAILARLSEGSRRVAVLAFYGLNADEIQYVLDLKPPAFRQRLAVLRRALGRLPPELREEALALAYSRPRPGAHRLDFGLIRRALLHHLQARPGIGTHDPDGHLLSIRAS